MPEHLWMVSIPAVALVLVARRIRALGALAAVSVPCPGCESGTMLLTHAGDEHDTHWWRCGTCGLQVFCNEDGTVSPAATTEPMIVACEDELHSAITECVQEPSPD